MHESVKVTWIIGGANFFDWEAGHNETQCGEVDTLPLFALESMGNSFSTNELKACISQDLKINVAFPFFATGRNEGSAACCVVRFTRNLQVSVVVAAAAAAA